ncbi:MAG: 1,4-dihydroxy-2-naphthoate octaprenyltransferase [Bacillota bacterium]
MKNVQLWLRALRAPFFTATAVPVLLGTAVAWYETGDFSPLLLLLSLCGAILLHGFTNLANDYFDHLSGNDNDNPGRSPYNGGAGLIQSGEIAAGQVLLAAKLCLAGVLAIAITLTVVRGWLIALLGVIGAVSGWIYTATPCSLVYRGWGELLVGINFGPLMVSGAYYVQSGHLSLRALWVAIPMGLLVSTVLYINEFADYEADRRVGKQTLIVHLGPRRAVIGTYLLFVGTYLAVLGGIVLRSLPLTALVTLLALPLGWKACTVTARSYAIPPQMVAASRAGIASQMAVGVLLAIAFISARLWMI